MGGEGMSDARRDPSFAAAMWRTVMLLLAIAAVVLAIDHSIATIRWLAGGSVLVLIVVSAWFHALAWARRNPRVH
jgi:hypothetical protein